MFSNVNAQLYLYCLPKLLRNASVISLYCNLIIGWNYQFIQLHMNHERMFSNVNAQLYLYCSVFSSIALFIESVNGTIRAIAPFIKFNKRRNRGHCAVSPFRCIAPFMPSPNFNPL